MGRKWQRYLNIHFSWEIISRKYATGAWGQGTDHPPQYLDKTKMGGGSNSTNTHINQDRLGKTEFQVRMVVEMIRYTCTVIETS